MYFIWCKIVCSRFLSTCFGTNIRRLIFVYSHTTQKIERAAIQQALNHIHCYKHLPQVHTAHSNVQDSMGWWKSEWGKGLTILLKQRQIVLLSMGVFCSLVLRTGIRLSSKNVFSKHSYLGIERKQRGSHCRAAKHAYTLVLCLKGIHTSATKRSHVCLLLYLLFYV